MSTAHPAPATVRAIVRAQVADVHSRVDELLRAISLSQNDNGPSWGPVLAAAGSLVGALRFGGETVLPALYPGRAGLVAVEFRADHEQSAAESRGRTERSARSAPGMAPGFSMTPKARLQARAEDIRDQMAQVQSELERGGSTIGAITSMSLLENALMTTVRGPSLPSSAGLRACRPRSADSAGRLDRGWALSASWGMPATHFTLVYDGDCRICRPLARLLVLWDRRHRLSVLPSTPEVREQFPQIPHSDFDEAVQLIDPSGSVLSGARAIEGLLHLLPLGCPLALLFQLPGARRLADVAYRFMARNRHRLGCGESCSLSAGLH